jgi:hypothetical protein
MFAEDVETEAVIETARVSRVVIAYARCAVLVVR